MNPSVKKGVAIVVVILIVIASGAFWWNYYFVFGEGVKAGELNFVVKKGYVFKTWEGRLIQSGMRSDSPGKLQSNEFEFSIASDSIARLLETKGGNFVELRYKEFFRAIPWRGNSKYIVTEVLRVEERRVNTAPHLQ